MKSAGECAKRFAARQLCGGWGGGGRVAVVREEEDAEVSACAGRARARGAYAERSDSQSRVEVTHEAENCATETGSHSLRI